ncbi:MAG: TrkH family potassium uptake protein [Smithellaceae bacterium]|nr:TrkH family potassium uptake protein [Smithellaceae bacterium]
MISRLKAAFSRSLTPARIFVLSFALLILTGALLLRLPFSVSGKNLSFVDALFTAASAVCVTGLTVLDIGQDLSLAGQLVTLLLFKVGGLGIITFSVLLFGLMGRGISFKDREFVQSTFLHTPRRDLLFIIKRVLFLSLAIEAAGAVFLFIRFAADFPPARAFYLAVYHAVSAFNNCGYSLFPDSLMSYREDWLINLTVMVLIVLGGIGFIVQHEVLSRLRGVGKRLSLHAKIVLSATGILILLGTALFCLLERDHTLKGLSPASALLISLFQSITSRTTGFNTVEIAQLANPTILLLMVLMFIGASPGSTGGGIKTTSFALLLFLIWSQIKGSVDVNVFHRTIPRENLHRTIAVILAAVLAIGLVAAMLLLGESPADPSLPANRHLMVEYIFETVSAFGTVGLSMGATAKLNDLQKLTVVFMMFAGRVGLLTLAFAWYAAKRKGLTYAEEAVMVG